VTALAAETAAPAEQVEHGARFIAMCEEYVFMTVVCGLDLTQAARAMHRSERVVERYRAHAARDRHLRRRVLRRYRQAK
jgi:FixJ family two-component response regulator